jgi:hypothetical protein
MAESANDKLTGIATLGTRRAPLPRDIPWPDDSLAAVEKLSPSAETRLLRTVAANSLFEGAGTRAAPEAVSGAAADFPQPGADLLPERAAWRLARIVSGEHPHLLAEWFTLAAASGRVLPPHLLPLVLEHVPPAARANFGAVLGPAARWLAVRHPTWSAAVPVTEFADSAWQEGSLPERVALFAALRKQDTPRSRAWLSATWDTDPPEAREAFLQALLPTVENQDEEFLEMALADKRKGVRQAAIEALTRLPESAHARRNLARVEPLLSLSAEPTGLLGKLRKRKLAVELPQAPDKAAQRDGVELKVPAAAKLGERTFWLMQMVCAVPPAHWCRRFACDAQTFLDAVLATDFKVELLNALTLAATRHPDAGWLTLLTRTWAASGRDFAERLQAVQALVRAASPEQSAGLAEMLITESKDDQFGLASTVLDSLDFAWSAALTRTAFEKLGAVAGDERATYPQPRNALDAWARHCHVAEGAVRGAALAARCGELHRWRNALDQFNEIVAFRAAMHEELRP